MKKQPKRKDRPGVDRYGRNELMNSVNQNDLDKVKAVIESGVNVNAKDDNGWTALHFAAQEFNEEIILFLLGKKADPNSTDLNGNTPISTALFNSKGRDTTVFDQFIKFGGNPELKNSYGVSAIDLARQVDNFDLKKYFPKYFTK